MKIDERIKIVLEKIGFESRYKSLGSDFGNQEHRLENYTEEKIQETFKDLGYKPKYFAKENFYQLKQEKSGVEITLNVSLKFGSVELILDVIVDKERYTVGGPFGMIYRLMGNVNRVKRPSFSNYFELKLILLRSVAIYEDIFSLLSLNKSNPI